MGLRPKYNVGDYVVDSELLRGSESIVRITNRKPVVEGFKVDWIYSGKAYELQINPINLDYKKRITAREEKLSPLSSRIIGS